MNHYPEPCLCGDPFCRRCFPLPSLQRDPDDEMERQRDEDSRRGEDDVDMDNAGDRHLVSFWLHCGLLRRSNAASPGSSGLSDSGRQQ